MAEVDLATLAVRVKSDGVDQATKQLGDLGKQAGETEARTDKLQESTARLVAKYVSFTAIAAAAATALRASVAQYAELQRATADLAAKTGIAGEALGVLVERSKELAGASTQSAAAILDAAEQVEGMLPGLNGNAEAIAEITRQAVILAEANGDELEPSVNALTQALQQFGGGAAEAARYANALVQAGNVGAASVLDLADAMERVGPAAGRAGISFEQTLGAIELLANKGIKGREAVGGLREFLDVLATSTEERFSPAVVGLEKALENLAAENLTAAARSKLFGESAADVAAVVIESRGEFANLTTQLTGTTAAADQAAIRMATLESQATMLQNRVALLGAEVGERLNPYLADLYDALGDSADAFTRYLQASSETQEKSVALGDAIRGVALWMTSIVAVGGGVIDTAQKVAEAFAAMWDSASQGSENTATNLRGIFREWQADMERMVDGVTAARDRLFDPQAQTSLAGPAPEAAGGAQVGGGAAEREAKAEALKANARREAQAAELSERAKFTEQYLDFLQRSSDDAYGVLAKANQQQLELQIEGDLAKWQAKIDLEEQVKEDAEERQNLLAERMKEWFETDLERTMEDYQLREEAINEFFDSQTLPNEEERARKLAAVHAQRERAIDALVRTGSIKRADFEKLTALQKTQFILGSAEQMTAGLAQHSKAAFQVNKAAGIASATISTYTAAARALAEGGPIAGPLLAAVMVAQGLAQVAAIKGTQFEGGGGGTTPSLAGSSGVVNGNPVNTAPPPSIDPRAQGQGRQTQIVIAGSFLDDRGMRDFADKLKDLVNDGDFNILGSDSRQAQDIVITQR